MISSKARTNDGIEIIFEKVFPDWSRKIEGKMQKTEETSPPKEKKNEIKRCYRHCFVCCGSSPIFSFLHSFCTVSWKRGVYLSELLLWSKKLLIVSGWSNESTFIQWTKHNHNDMELPNWKTCHRCSFLKTPGLHLIRSIDAFSPLDGIWSFVHPHPIVCAWKTQKSFRIWQFSWEHFK